MLTSAFDVRARPGYSRYHGPMGTQSAVSMHTPPAVPEKLIAGLTRGADKILLAVLRRVFMTNDAPEHPEDFAAVLARLQRYVDPAVLADPTLLIPRHGSPDTVEVVERRPLFGPRRSVHPIEIGFEEQLQFASPYAPLDPTYAEEFAGYPEVARTHLWAWRHLDPAPVTILLTHGWGVGPWWMHKHEYDVPFLFHRLGLDVYFYQAPFHGLRIPNGRLIGGQLHPSADLVRTNEAFIQTATELHAIISLILERNPTTALGMMGSSLGGYTSALMASLDERLDFVIPVLPPASMAHLLWDHGAGMAMQERAIALGIDRDRFHDFWALHSPLSHTPKVPWERRMIVTGLGDTLVTAEHTRDLWEHWQRPRHFRFPGGHAWQLRRRLYHREIGRFLRDIELLDETDRPK